MDDHQIRQLITDLFDAKLDAIRARLDAMDTAVTLLREESNRSVANWLAIVAMVLSVIGMVVVLGHK